MPSDHVSQATAPPHTRPRPDEPPRPDERPRPEERPRPDDPVPEVPAGRRRTGVPLGAVVAVLVCAGLVGLLAGSQGVRVLADGGATGPVPAAGPLRWWVWPATMLVLAVWAVASLGAALRRTRLDAVAAGLDAERARFLRTLHDTVLQDLEVMARASELDRAAPAEAVAQLRGTARGHALRLRRAMSDLMDGGRAGSLATGLTDVAAEFAPAGLRVELVVAQGLPELSADHREATCAAVRAALGNVVKHAKVGYAVVRADRARGGIEVVVRDNGAGFDAGRRPAGFGVRQSIVARMRQVGGDATVESSPGRGTRVRLWAPR